MALLCFVLDLRSLSPTILRDLKQSLLQLANLYAVSRPKINTNSLNANHSNPKPLLDRIGLCYVSRNRVSCLDELRVAYNPHGNFNLRDLHHAVTNLPTDAFFPESSDFEAASVCKDLKLADILSEKIVYNWGGHDKKAEKKVIVISSCLVGTLDSETMKALMHAADKCVFIEFISVEQVSHHPGDNINHFLKQIGPLKNCSFQTCVPDLQVLSGLAKRWFQELQYYCEEPLQARFVFKTNLISSLNQISCSLFTSFSPIVDDFTCVQTCRCHGIPLDHSNMNHAKSCSSCPVTNDDLGALDIIVNSVRVGEQTILYMPSFHYNPKLKQVSSLIDLNVIQRTNLGSLSEGLIMGATFFVTASTFRNSDENDKSELNRKLFQVVCCVLNSLDQGLICSSSCNIETGMETSFQCYYILLPSDKGLMLLRRLSASEEYLPIPDISQHIIGSAEAEEIQNTVQASLLKMEVSDYNPFQHERGFHKKLNFLVKESLQFGAIHPKSKEVSDLDLQSSESQPSNSKHAADIVVTGDDQLPQHENKQGEKSSGQCLTEEWEQLIITELGGTHSPTCISHSKLDPMVTSPSQSNRQLDEKTSRILERLEVPRQLKRKAVSPTLSSSFSADMFTPAKKPLIPYRPTDVAEQGPISSQLIKPSFQRIRKK